MARLQSPFLTLGIPATSDAQAVRAAYRRLVKTCHPDIVQGEAEKLHAQEKMIALNLAYEEALRIACRPEVRTTPMPDADILRMAQRLLDRRAPASAIRALDRCVQRGAMWYYLYGCSLDGLGQHAQAHMQLRRAVRLEPENNLFRAAALKSYTAQRKQRGFPQRLAAWASDVLRGRR